MSNLNNALALAAKGFKIFPIAEGAKYPPLIRNWPQRASSNEAELKTWWTKWPRANVAIHCTGLIVLDVDVRNNGEDSLAKLHLIHGLPNTLITRTPTGGGHIFYRLPREHAGVSNNANALGPGIDVKSTNGYVVAPGSEVKAGRYRFEADTAVTDAPEWLLMKLGTNVPKTGTSRAQVPNAANELVLKARDWLSGQPRGDQAFKTACGLRDLGLSQAQAQILLSEHDGRPLEIIMQKTAHAYRYAQNEPGVKVACAEDFPLIALKRENSLADRSNVKPRRLLEIARLPTGHSGYLVKGLLQRKSHAVMYGAPGQGKTFVALDIAYHVAAGRQWHSRKVHQGTVLYLAYEGVGGLAKRAAALVKQYGQADVPLYIQGADYNLRDFQGRQRLAEDLATLADKPVLIVVDTLARALRGGDENSAQDMGALNDAVSALIESTAACVLLVHHSGKNKTSGARGSSALLGAIDTEAEIDSRQVLTRKQRDVELIQPIGFKLVPVLVGMDEDGEEVTSCVVEAATVSEAMLSSTSKLRGDSKLVFEALCDVSPDNQPITKDRWMDACLEFLPQDKAKASKAMYAARVTLMRMGVIEEINGRFKRKLV